VQSSTFSYSERKLRMSKPNVGAEEAELKKVKQISSSADEGLQPPEQQRPQSL